MQIKSDQNNTGWEEAEFPIACETCLGDNPYVRMTKEPHGKACKICERPYCVFRWRPGTNARYKSTQVSLLFFKGHVSVSAALLLAEQLQTCYLHLLRCKVGALGTTLAPAV
jgi:hypothetical protein